AAAHAAARRGLGQPRGAGALAAGTSPLLARGRHGPDALVRARDVPARPGLPAAAVAGGPGRGRRLAGAAGAAGPLAAERRRGAGVARLPADTAGAAEPGDPRLPPGADAGSHRPPGPLRHLEGARPRLHVAAAARERVPGIGVGRDLRDDPAS